MKRNFVVLALITFVSFVAAAVALPPANKEAETFWPSWRGPEGTGVAPKAKPPVEFGPEKNIKWKAEIPGTAHATPAVWGDRVYLLTAIKTDKKPEGANEESPAAEGEQGERPRRRPGGGGGRGDGSGGGGGDMPVIIDDVAPMGMIQDGGQDREGNRAGGQPPPGEGRRRPGGRGPGGPGGRGGRGARRVTEVYQFDVIALDRKNGKEVWRTTVCEEVPHEAGHDTASQASASPIVDGERIYAHFGSRGLYCLDLDGKVLWSKKFPKMRTANGFGEGSSPAVYGDTVVVNCDNEDKSFIVALNAKTGKELWKKDRDERTSWSTPVILEVNGKPQAIVTATRAIRAYDLKSGDVVWSCKGMTANAIPTPVYNDKLLYAISGFRGAALLAIDYAKAKGDISDSKTVVWSHDKATPYVPSPLLYDDCLYFLDNNRAILSCFDARKGEPHYEQQRLEGVSGMVYASIVGAGGHVYIASRDGKVLVLKKGPEYEVVATNEFPDEFDASPAIAGDEIYLRGKNTLYCIARK